MLNLHQLLQHKAVQIALAIVALIFAGSIAYYLIASAPPAVAYATAATGNITADVTATGVVSPLQNPTLSFEAGGQVVAVNASVGQKVAAGAFLASTDTGVLSASLEGAQAKLNELEAGPRSVDLAAQQTAVATAEQSLVNAYANYPQLLSATLSKAEEAVYTEADPLFDMTTYKTNSALIFSTNNSSTKITADEERAGLETEFTQWQAELASAGSTPSPAELQTLTSDSIAHLNHINAFLNDLVIALNDAEVGGTFTVAQKTTGLTAANAARDTVNTLISSLTSSGQSVASQRLMVESATDQLNQSVAGATPQDIEAQQAQVAGIEAQIRQQEIIAPFAGTIASVSIKPGDVVSANTPAISLVPSGTFEVDVYLAENEVAQLKAGDPTDITLDAYGANRVFPASVSSIDASPSTDPNNTASTGYKVTLVFAGSDPAIANGMHANATVHAGSAQNVLLIPKSAVITDGTQSFVLEQTPAGLVKTPVTLGLSSADSVEVVSGLSAGARVSSVGAQ